MDALLVVIVLAIIATFATMAMGLLSMSSSGSIDKTFSTPLMWTRIGLQGATIVLLGLAVMLR